MYISVKFKFWGLWYVLYNNWIFNNILTRLKVSSLWVAIHVLIVVTPKGKQGIVSKFCSPIWEEGALHYYSLRRIRDLNISIILLFTPIVLSGCQAEIDIETNECEDNLIDDIMVLCHHPWYLWGRHRSDQNSPFRSQSLCEEESMCVCPLIIGFLVPRKLVFIRCSIPIS